MEISAGYNGYKGLSKKEVMIKAQGDIPAIIIDTVKTGGDRYTRRVTS